MKSKKSISQELSNALLKTNLGCAVISLFGIIGITITSLHKNALPIFIGIAAIVILFIIFSILNGREENLLAIKTFEPVRRLAEISNSVAEGNFDIDFPFFMDDEMKNLAGGLKNIIKSIKLVEKDAAVLAKYAADGHFDSPVDISCHNGDYRRTAESMIEIFESFREPFSTLSGFVGKLADGVHQNDIENKYKGDFRILFDNLNETQHSLNNLVDEADKLAQAGREGNLSVHGNDSKFEGSYKCVITDINEIFAAFQLPMDAASEFISGLASGTVSKPIENSYEGSYADLINKLNGILESLLIMLNESKRLTLAGQQGDLNLRSDTSKVPGHYASIVKGMNSMMDAISTPLQEANIVLQNITQNNFTVQMKETYKGAFKDLSVSVNSVIERLKSIEHFVIDIGNGIANKGQIEALQKIGKRSENDKLTPSMLQASLSVGRLIDLSNHLSDAATQGNLNERGNASEFKGGYKQIIEGLNNTLEAFVCPITESAKVLNTFSNGDLTTEITGEYKGEYSKIKDFINKTIVTFRSLISQINVAANQVSAGSSQMSSASVALSQGTTEQASSIEELTSSITEVASQVRENAENAHKTEEIAKALLEDAIRGDNQMKQMLDSMQEINEGSNNISKIIKVIDDIAFQTNILSLNAAVEAARAGQAGKGFAVVADEVRNLAAKSANAAKETTSLIEDNIKKVGLGTKIASDTAMEFDKIVKGVKNSATFINSIAEASNQQATAISQIDTGIEQLSTVVQNNSATAEEGAASSEELSGQAESLKQLVNKFVIKGNSDMSPTEPTINEIKRPTKIRLASANTGGYGKY